MEPVCYAWISQNPVEAQEPRQEARPGSRYNQDPRKPARRESTCRDYYTEVPYLPSSKVQTLNITQLLEGRTGRLADLGSGDGRVVFAASSAGFQCTGFEINSILVACAKSKALWTGVPSSQATFVKKDFWKTDLSTYNNVTAFLAPGVMEVLGEKLLKELPDDACVVTSRFPFPDWPQKSSVGSGLDQTFSYDISTVRSHLRKIPKTVLH
ncbi:ATP synthase subunit C lysine N-methyltransferase isoform X3 [Cebidichthys violaceus]|uniref:ATP synthase subunit C lysine N-methyltransferase isoform X3 n=1 Tax=Cebidichthys violaceus TaxID=271503 RepID=UPI0035CC8388